MRKLALLIMLVFFGIACADTAPSSAIFYYGKDVSINALRSFDIIIIDPNVTDLDPKQFDATSQCFAYVSTGEIDPSQKYFNKIHANWIIGENKTWKTKILDPNNLEWRKFFIDEIITPLWLKGYRGFFLDTLDSYNQTAKNSAQKNTQINGMIELVKAIKQKYPEAKLIFNRGFELLPKTHDLAYAITAESLFYGWNQNSKNYEIVSEQARTLLLKELEQIKPYNLPVIIIDYLSSKDHAKAQITANKIKKLGFIPYIANSSLTSLGISNIEIVSRKILTLYDGKTAANAMYDANVFRRANVILEYLGYVPELIDVQKFILTDDNITNGDCAGILVWFDTDYLKNNEKLQNWLIKQKENGIPIILLGNAFSYLNKNFVNAFNLLINNTGETPASIKIIYKSTLIDYEITSFPNLYDFFPITTQEGTVLLNLQDNLGRKMDAAAITPWGGYVIDPFVLTVLPNDQSRWIINPIAFFRAALQKNSLPVPDTTTENGRRLMFVHVDGDGFVSRAEHKPEWQAGQVMRKEIFERFKIPTTVSVIQGEIDPEGVYPKESRAGLENARNIFALPWVEIASHTYSHPFSWYDLDRKQKEGRGSEGLYGLYLNIPNYKFNLDAEIIGSANFINQQLAPKNKATKIIAWSGDCNPSSAAMAMAAEEGLLNINGGNTDINDSQKALTNIGPLGFHHGKYFQVFAQAQNENVYTNLWLGPYYGYRRVIETFKLTNEPLRFKPIDIYFHFFSATKIASLEALKEVYTWALMQPVFNIYTSEYIKKALDFNDIAIAKKANGWLISTNGNLKELRTPKTMGAPDLLRSKNIIGFIAHGDDYYIHLGPEKKSWLIFTKQQQNMPYIESANGQISYFKRSNNDFSFKIASYMPLTFTLANMHNCQLYQDPLTAYFNSRLPGLNPIATGFNSHLPELNPVAAGFSLRLPEKAQANGHQGYGDKQTFTFDNQTGNNHEFFIRCAK